MASEDFIISPSFPDSEVTTCEDTEQAFLAQQVEVPGVIKVRAKVGSSFVNNITPFSH